MLAATLPAGCAGGSESTKAGGGAAPLTLRIGTDDPPGRPGSDQLEELARRVARLSGGKLRVEPVFNAGGDGSDWDQRVARRVASGDLDLGLVPARAWDTEGVTTLRALNAPFLIDSDELLGEVLAGDLAGDLMAGLDTAGVVGLALLPDGLRHPFGFRAPLLGPDDYAGKTIRTPTSHTTAAVFAALGAETSDADANAGSQAGIESAYEQLPSGTATGNVTFYPKANVLVAGADRWNDLGSARREILTAAAAETRAWAIDTTPTDAEAARAWCERGGAIVRASAAEVAGLEAATAPVYEEIGRDPRTRTLIEAIRALKRELGVPAAAPAPCGDAAAGAGSAEAADPDARFDGVYRFEITDEQIRAEGITDPVDIDENHGVFTVTLQGGEYCWKQRAPNFLNNPDECSTFSVEGDRVVWRFPVGPPEVYRVRRTARGDLRLAALKAPPGELRWARIWAANTWRRIGRGE